MGLPKYLDLTTWEKCREIVSGMIINCFCPDNTIVTLLFHYKNLKGSLKPICEMGAVTIPSVENVDTTPHYRRNSRQLLPLQWGYPQAY